MRQPIGQELGKTLTWRITMAKLDSYKIDGYFIIVEQSESGNDFTTYINAKWHGDNHGVRLKSSDQLRELYELLGSILFNYDHEMDLKLLKPPLGKEPF